MAGVIDFNTLEMLWPIISSDSTANIHDILLLINEQVKHDIEKKNQRIKSLLNKTAESISKFYISIK
jgi:hypothetical protein